MKAKKKYMGGGKLAKRAADSLGRRSKRQADKAAKSMDKAARLKAKSETPAEGKGAGMQNLKNKINAERAAKRANIGRAQQARSERSAKASNFASKRADIGAANKANRGVKAEIRAKYENGGKGMKYENGGKLSKSKRPKKMKEMSGKDRKAVGNPASNKSVKKFSEISRGSVADAQLRYNTGKSAADFLKATQKAQGVPNKALATKTEGFGPGYGKKTYSEGNPGGLKGRTKGKGGNVGAGVKVKKKGKEKALKNKSLKK